MNTIKRGDTLALSGNAGLTLNGAAVTDYSGWAAACQLRTIAGTLVADLSASIAANGLLVISAPAAATALWPLGAHELDIQFTAPTGEVISSGTATLVVAKDITR